MRVEKFYIVSLFLLFILKDVSKAKQIRSDDSTIRKYHESFVPGKTWLDTKGNPINAHGGGVIFYQQRYYWYGEHKLPNKSEKDMADGGIHCYSSSDLTNWSDEGLVLSVNYDNNSSNDLSYGCILERPKVVYDSLENKFYAYFKLYLKGKGYTQAYMGVATATKPTGPFRYQGKFLGGDSNYGSGDFCIFETKDGAVLHSTVRKPDKTFVIGELNRNHLSAISGSYQAATGISLHTEAPVMLQFDNKFYILGSGSSGWNPNAARAFVADSPRGNYQDLGNPVIGNNPNNNLGPEKTFGGQISYVLPVHGLKNAYIAMFDVWNPESPARGLYIWLPIKFIDNRPVIKWIDKWDLSYFNKF